MTETAFHYSNQRVTHRIVTGATMAAIVLLVAIMFPETPLFVRILLLIGVAVVLNHVIRFQRLRSGGGPALTLRSQGLDVPAWRVGIVPWSEIADAHLVARNNIRIRLKQPQLWKQKMTQGTRMLGMLETIFGAGMFTIDGGMLEQQPGTVLAEIKARLENHA
ncbi:MAG: hypothetical protein OES46_14370 [Gammaproteobacteria bacterium]|jgi:hypothetical protein|nr:hypothetical protein [Gammaproteobacteria bacterium]